MLLKNVILALLFLNVWAIYAPATAQSEPELVLKGESCVKLIYITYGGNMLEKDYRLENQCKFPVTLAWCLAGGRPGGPPETCKAAGQRRAFTYNTLEHHANIKVFIGDLASAGLHVVHQACRGRNFKASEVGERSEEMRCELKTDGTSSSAVAVAVAPPPSNSTGSLPNVQRQVAPANDFAAARAQLVATLQSNSAPSETSERSIRSGLQAALRASARAFEQKATDKSRKIHNNANDATECLRVEPTGVREEWGMQGRMALINTCSYPIEATWCANDIECSSGGGNLWPIQARASWPIFTSDPNNPRIRVSACKTGAQRAPLPSDAALGRAGGINERHYDPQSSPGVSRMLDHVCE